MGSLHCFAFLPGIPEKAQLSAPSAGRTPILSSHKMCKASPAVYSSEVFFFSLDSSEFCSTVPDFSYQCLQREPFSFPHQCSEVLHSLAGLAKGCPSLEKSRPVIRSYKTSPCFDISTAPTTDLLPGLTMPKRVVKSFFHRPRENKCTKRPSLNTQVGQRFV